MVGVFSHSADAFPETESANNANYFRDIAFKATPAQEPFACIEGGKFADDMGTLAERVNPSRTQLLAAIAQARTATDQFAQWLRDESASKTGPSGIGKEQYTWYLRNVLLLPLSWEEEVTITPHATRKREPSDCLKCGHCTKRRLETAARG